MTKRVCVVRQSTYIGDMSVQREVLTLYEAGFEVHVICLDAIEAEDTYPRECVIDGVHVHRMPTTRKKRGVWRYLYDYGLFFLFASIKLTRLHLQKPFDVIQVNTMPDFLVFITMIPKLLGAKIIVMMQEPVPELWQTLRHSPAPFPIIWAEQGALWYANQALTVTEQLKQAYVSRGAQADKISVILNVPEMSLLEVDVPPAQIDPNFFTLVCHGAIESRYGHDTMLEAIALVRSQIPQIRLRITGAGEYAEQFQTDTIRLGLQDHVEFLGWVSLKEMVQAIQSADVGIVAQKSSLYSNLVHTNKMYEYIAFGKPVLASRLQSVAAYFPNDALEYFTPADPNSLAEGIINLYQDPTRRQTLVQNAQTLYNQYRWDTQKSIYLSAYQ